MSYRRTRRISLYLGIAWLCYLAFVIVVRSAEISLGSVQPEAVALVGGILAIPGVALTIVAISGTAIYDFISGRKGTAANLAK